MEYLQNDIHDFDLQNWLFHLKIVLFLKVKYFEKITISAMKTNLNGSKLCN